MRRLLLIFLALLAPIITRSQTTLVSGTVTDSGSQAWINGTYTFTSAGLGLTPITGTLDATGSFTNLSFPHTPATGLVGDVWVAKVCPAFTYGCFTSNPIVVTGNSQTLNFTPGAIAIKVPSTPQAVTPVQAYADSEITGGWPGFAYWNVTSSTSRQCVSVTGTVCTWSQLPNTSGSVTFTGALNANGTNTLKNLNSIQFADQFTGADGGAQIQAAIAALPTSGGTVFAQGLLAHTWGENIFTTNKAVDLYLPASTITLTTAQTPGSNVNIHCVPTTDSTHGTIFTGTLNTGSWFTWQDLFTSTMDGCSFVKTGTAGGTLFSVIDAKYIRLTNFQNINGNWADILFLNSDATGSCIYNRFQDWFLGSSPGSNFIHLTSTGGAGKITANNWFVNLASLVSSGTGVLMDSGATSTIDVSALASAAEAVFADNNTTTVGTIDSTAQLFLQHTIAFSAASASNSATDRHMIADTVD